eukprot:3200392-Pyramimonas_sp.AAC.1
MNGAICLTGPGCQSGGAIIISRRERRHRSEILTERERAVSHASWHGRTDGRIGDFKPAAPGAAQAREFVESVGGPQLSAAR